MSVELQARWAPRPHRLPFFSGIAVAADPVKAGIIAIEKCLWQAWADADPARTEAPAAE